MGTATVISGILTQFEEIVEVVMPCLEVGSTGTTTFTALVHGHELVIMQLEERDNALRFTVRPLYEATGATDCGP